MATVLEQTGTAILSPLLKLWYSFLAVLPGLVGALLTIIVGYIVASFVGYVVKRLLDKTHLLKWTVKKTKTTKYLGKAKLSYFFSQITKWYVFILFLNPAAEVTNLRALSQFFISLAVWVPNVIAAILIGLFGYIAALYVEEQVKGTKAAGSVIIADILRVIVLVFTGILAFGQLGINVGIAQNSFLIVLSGITFAIALAIGLGFGLGMKDDAKLTVKSFLKKL